MDSDVIKRKISFSHYGGRASAFEDIENDLKRRSGELFSSGNDKAAELVRELAKTIGKRALDERKKQKDYEPILAYGGISDDE